MSDDDLALAPAPDDWAAQLLKFWFEDHNEADWFKGGPEFDAEVTARFADWREALRTQPVEAFMNDDNEDILLAAILLFDQVPRNAYRGTAEAFATDHMALKLAEYGHLIWAGTLMSKEQRLFCYLPFEHSENADDQRASVRLISLLGNDQWTQFALDHQAMIDRFGRFPHRNAALGRANRPGEAEAVAAGGGW